MDAYTIVSTFFVLLIGLCFGSFMNVVVLRAFSGESISYPASKCPTCQKPLYWWHNIPVLSYILLGGKCHFCKTHISWQYPIVELVTAVLFVFSYLKFGMSINLLYLWAVIFMSLVLAITDIKEQVVFTLHCVILILIGLIYNAGTTGILALSGAPITFWHNPLTDSVEGMLLGGFLMLLYVLFSSLLAGRLGTGDGDIYIMLGLGACFGLVKLPFILVLSVVYMAIIGLAYIAYDLIKKKNFKPIIDTAKYSAIILTMVVVLNVIRNIDFFLNHYYLVQIFVILLIITTVYILWVNVIKKIRSGEHSGVPIAFGPALILGGLTMLFFSKEVFNLSVKLISFMFGV